MGEQIEIQGHTGDSVAIPIFLTTDSALMAFSLGFELGSTDIFVSSIESDTSTTGTQYRVSSKISNETGKFSLYGMIIVGEPLMPPVDSLRFNIWIQIPRGTPPQVIDIDSCVSFYPDPNIDFIFGMPDRAFTPDYIDHGPELIITYPDYICGDANGDGKFSLSDLVWMINFFLLQTSDTVYYLSGDVNCDQNLSISDLVWMINSYWQAGSRPCDIDADGIPDC